MRFFPLVCFLLCISASLCAQRDYLLDWKTVSGTVYDDEVTYDYRVDVGIKVIPMWLSEVKVDFTFKNFIITRLTYKGVEANSNHGFSAPFDPSASQAHISADLVFSDGNMRYTASDLSSMNVAPRLSMNYDFLSEHDREAIKSKFNITTYEELMQLNFTIGNCSLDKVYFDFDMYSIYSRIREEQNNAARAERLKSELDGYGETETEDLQKRRELYEKLQEVDPSASDEYGREITNIDEKLSEIEAKEIAEAEEAEKEAAAAKAKEEDAADGAEESTASDEETAADEESTSTESAPREPTVAEKVADYEDRVAEANRQNAALASAAASSTTSVLFLMALGMYKNYGNASHGRIFYPGNSHFRLGMEIGYTVSTAPTIFASRRSSINYSTGDVEWTDATTTSTPLPINVNFNLRMGYQGEIGDFFALEAEALGGIRGGMSLVMSDFHWAYHAGGRVAAGLPSVKAMLGYRYGQDAYSVTRILDAEEYGDGETRFQMHSIRTGLTFSWWGNDRAYGRKHLSIGVLQDRIAGLGKDMLQAYDFKDIPFVRRDFETLEELYTVLDIEPNYTMPAEDPLASVGYFLEYRHDHFGTLIVDYYPKYFYTGYWGKTFPDTEDVYTGGMKFNIGFVRNLDWFY